MATPLSLSGPVPCSHLRNTRPGRRVALSSQLLDPWVSSRLCYVRDSDLESLARTSGQGSGAVTSSCWTEPAGGGTEVAMCTRGGTSRRHLEPCQNDFVCQNLEYRVSMSDIGVLISGHLRYRVALCIFDIGFHGLQHRTQYRRFILTFDIKGHQSRYRSHISYAVSDCHGILVDISYAI
jgi:hypothetical protein